jgi:maltooligosyltrehalose synthase
MDVSTWLKIKVARVLGRLLFAVLRRCDVEEMEVINTAHGEVLMELINDTIALGFDYWRKDWDEDITDPNPCFDKLRSRAGLDRVLVLEFKTGKVLSEIYGTNLRLQAQTCTFKMEQINHE